jgi:phosphoenolpyruvate carboxylase
MITQNFGHPNRAERTMDIYTAAICAEMHTPRPFPSKEWRSLMDELSRKSCQVYRGVVREDERFVPYFRSATPELELADLNIGSRPAKRKASGGVESLRAIPWIFAWTQTRLNLPTWLGVGEALGDMLGDKEKSAKLRNMYNSWPSFRTTIDLVEMVLAKSEPAIARHYDNVLVKDEKAKLLGSYVRSIHEKTEQAVLDLTGHELLCEDNQLLRRALYVRNPYVDCMNVLQVEIMRRLRQNQDMDNDEQKVLKDALLISITGIANGMGNTG